MFRINRMFTILLLTALLLSACQPVQAPAPSAATPPSDVLSGFVENDGLQIHYEVEGQGPPLILLHWWTGSLEDWRLFGYVDALKDTYRLILIDARGHGQSDKPHDPAAYAMEQQVGDVVAVLDELGIDKAHYFGYSMGGTLGWAIGKFAPDRLSSLIIGGDAPENYDPSGDISSVRELGAEGWGQMVVDVSGAFGFLQPEIYDVYAANDIEAVVADVTAFSAENFAASLSDMTMPVLLLAGTEDSDHAALEDTAKKLPNATFASLPGFDHAATFLQTDLVLEHVTKFLAQVEKAGLGDATVAEIEPQGLRQDAPQYALHGPYWVGYQPLVIGEGTDHPLQAGLWYPALNPKGAEEAVTYPITLKFPTDPLDAPMVVYGRALLDAEIDTVAAPYPLVVFSHGFGANAVWYNTLIEHYASYGFIVLAPEHVEQFDPDWSGILNASIDRPRDIKQTLDYAEQMNAPGGVLAGLIDMENVAVAGHSYGGYTALAMAGAQYDVDAFNARCAQLPADDPNAFLCTPLASKEADLAARAGLDPMPEGLWPSFGDPRVTAILPMAGDSYLFDKAGLSKITVPMMAIGGTADTGTPYDWGSRPSYDYASSARKTLVTMEGAEHTITTLCEGMPWVSETPFYGWICFDPVWDKDRGVDLINHFSTAFLLAELKGDADAAAALAPENVSFPGIQYETTGFAK